MKNVVKIRLKHWWWYFIPSIRRWARDCERSLNSVVVKKEMAKEMSDSLHLYCLPGGLNSIKDNHSKGGNLEIGLPDAE